MGNYQDMDTCTNKSIIVNSLTQKTEISTPKQWKGCGGMKNIVIQLGLKTVYFKQYVASFLFLKVIPHHTSQVPD